MHTRKFINLILSILIAASFMLSGSVQESQAMPMDPVDESKVPHYFGPNPNWANSPFTLPDAQVVITGNGTGATAEATVGANGVITAITVTNPGHDYSSAKVDIFGPGTGAKADAVIVKKGSVVAVTVDAPGAGYTAPTVTFSDGAAAATAYGGVDQVILTNPGDGYTMPTVDFDLPDGPDGVQAKGHAVCVEQDCVPATPGGSVTIVGIAVDDPGSGYSFAPGVAIHNGTLFAPLPMNDPKTPAAATSTLSIQSIVLDAFGADFINPPLVTIADSAGGTGSGAAATAALDNGIISDILLKDGGSGYLIPGMRKFVDTLPGLGPGGANKLGQYIPLAVPDQDTFPDDPDTPENEGADYYEIAVVEYSEQMHRDLPPTKLRGYVQLETTVVDGNVNYPLPGGKIGLDKPHYLGPTIVAQKDRAVRITFYNLLPTDAGGDLFIPVDSTIMGSGEAMMDPDMGPVDQGLVTDDVRNPMCTDAMSMGDMCFPKNRATLHLHGGNVPWISDGTPHQWITPDGETTTWPEGVSVQSVPDMVGQAAIDKGIPDCSGANDGCMTFYYTNQQSARLMFYHDHSWGITRLNVYAGEAAGYIIQDNTEKKLVDNGTLPGAADTIPLVIQDKTFVPQDAQLYNQYDPVTGELLSYGQDPTWDAARWGGFGNLWYHHVYMTAQNPGAPGGMSSFGRWMYAPWFWPPQNAKYDPIPNPYYGKDPEGPDGLPGTMDDWTTFLATPCNLDDPDTWQYQEEPWCEPPLIPSTPLISAGMEQFNDTPLVNGTAYPTVTLQPKSYRLRILNAANDRFWNLQWYIGDPTTASRGLNANGDVIGATEVALDPAELAAAQLDPVVFPTPVQGAATAGPDWVVFGSEGGFLPAPVVVDGQQFTTWIEDPTRFDNGLVDQHSLLLAPAERADVVVDFSRFAGQTLILYNDAPAAFPARIPSYDYYTGAPDLRPVGAPAILPGYGPNTRTIMQVKIAGTPAPAFNLSRLQSAFRHKADGSGVFEFGQHPVIVGQQPYNSAYGSSFASSGWCNAPGSNSTQCDGYARISEQGGEMFGFNTLLTGTSAKVQVKIEPKSIQDETSESNFDEFGRMTALLGLEVVPATPGVANAVLYPYTYPLVDIFDTSGLPTADVKVTPISSGDDGTQIWKITHNGVDTHPIHFHATDVQVINRVTWDNIIKPPHPSELGWKETVRVSPLEDTYFAIRPVIPKLPFDFPNSIRLLSQMMPEGEYIANTTQADQDGLPLLAFAPNGDPIDIKNHYINYGGEYVYHCHILSHEEMDMMHAVSFTFPPVAPGGLAFDALTGILSWTDNSLSETAFAVEKSSDGGISWTEVGRIDRLLEPGAGSSIGGIESFTDSAWVAGDQFRVVAENTVGDTADYSDPNLNEIPPGTYAFPVFTTTAVSEVLTVAPPPTPPLPPSGLTATLVTGPPVGISLAWTDNSLDETGFLVRRSTDGVNFTDLATVAANTAPNPVTYLDSAVVAGTTYTYQVAAVNQGGTSAFAVSNSVTVPGPQPPNAPTQLAAVYEPGPPPSIALEWADNSADETGFVIERSTDVGPFSVLANVVADVTAYDDLAVFGGYTYTYRVAAFNATGSSDWSDPVASASVPPNATAPVAPSNLSVSNVTQTTLTLSWLDNANNETNFTIQRATDANFTRNLETITVGPNATNLASYADSGLKKNTKYFYRVNAFNANFTSAWSASLNVTTAK